MNITYDPDKRAAILNLWDIDLADAGKVFESAHLTVDDDKLGFDTEVLFITIGHLSKRMVVLTWTARAHSRHIISIRIANERENQKYGPRFAE
ncbi:MAG: BrnT family toxin [Cypionkella sp.]